MKHPIAFLGLVLSAQLFAITPDQKDLPIGLAPHETGRLSPPQPTAPPIGPVHALPEWEEPEAVMTLWTNPSLVSALVQHGPVKLFADSRQDQNWWTNWLEQNHIPTETVSYFNVPTDSMWIRDYGPWPILDANGQYGLVHNTYNRPRPRDNKVAAYIAKALGVPFFDTGLVHTGGNFYNDGLGNAFSSTLVYSENSKLSRDEINSRMQKFLGIDEYTTSPLAPGITIEHLDTFGKLVAPDTWVFSQFPEGSPYRADSEAMVAKLRAMTSPYGTPYRIFRLKMVEARDNYRAYINSFISNGALYFPKYGDEVDDEVKATYQSALPGYDIVPVDAMGTEWGDSVHCRTRNLIKRDAIFLFPHVTKKPAHAMDVTVEVFPSPGATVKDAPVLHWCTSSCHVNSMKKSQGRTYLYSIPPQTGGTKISMYIEANDTSGKQKVAPGRAPAQEIEVVAN